MGVLCNSRSSPTVVHTTTRPVSNEALAVLSVRSRWRPSVLGHMASWEGRRAPAVPACRVFLVDLARGSPSGVLIATRTDVRWKR